MIMIGQTTPAPASIYLYVHDVDAVYSRAVEAGATLIDAPSDKPYGDRNATVKDVHGITWFIASRIESDDVIARRMKAGHGS
jgi:PhnB protein